MGPVKSAGLDPWDLLIQQDGSVGSAESTGRIRGICRINEIDRWDLLNQRNGSMGPVDSTGRVRGIP